MLVSFICCLLALIFEFIHVEDMLHEAWGVVFLRIVMHYFSKFVVVTSR